VQPLGHLSHDQLAAVRERASIFVAPARYEPFGLSILEAARAGCALVLADIPSLRELWTDAAVFVNPEDAAAMHSQLAALISDDDMRQRLGSAARMRSRRYSVERMTRAYLALYDRIGASHPEVVA
jgi:glycosyltransferase involved in cell wall biosynthesis